MAWFPLSMECFPKLNINNDCIIIHFDNFLDSGLGDLWHGGISQREGLFNLLVVLADIVFGESNTIPERM